MPTDDGFRFDDHECRSPSGPRARQPCPEPPVRRHEPQSPGPRPIQYLKLVPQGEYLELKCRATGDNFGPTGTAKPGRKSSTQSLSREAPNINGRNTYGILSRHTLTPPADRGDTRDEARQAQGIRSTSAFRRPAFCQSGSDLVDIKLWNVRRAQLHCLTCGQEAWLEHADWRSHRRRSHRHERTRRPARASASVPPAVTSSALGSVLIPAAFVWKNVRLSFFRRAPTCE